MNKLLKAIIVFVILNLIIIGIQFIPRIGDLKHLKEIDATLSVMEHDIAVSENELKQLDSEITEKLTRLSTLDSEMEKLLNRYPNGAPASIVAMFNSFKTEGKNLLTELESKEAIYNTKYSSYELMVDKYNNLVAEYNSLGSRTSRYFAIIPIPRFK